MNSKQFQLSQRGLVSFVSAAVLLTLTTVPTLADNGPGLPTDRPVRCCVVGPGDQTPYSDDCFGPEESPRFPLIIADSQDLKLTKLKDKM